MKTELRDIIETASFLTEGFVSSGLYKDAYEICASNHHMGQIEILSEVTSYTELLAGLFSRAFKRFGHGGNGVYNYDVVSEFGIWLCREIEITGAFPTPDKGKAKAEGMNAAYWLESGESLDDIDKITPANPPHWVAFITTSKDRGQTAEDEYIICESEEAAKAQHEKHMDNEDLHCAGWAQISDGTDCF